MAGAWNDKACPLNCEFLKQGTTSKGMGFVCSKFKTEIEVTKSGIPLVLSSCKSSRKIMEGKNND